MTASDFVLAGVLLALAAFVALCLFGGGPPGTFLRGRCNQALPGEYAGNWVRGVPLCQPCCRALGVPDWVVKHPDDPVPPDQSPPGGAPA